MTAGTGSERTRGPAPRLVVFERRYIPKGLAPRFDIGEGWDIIKAFLGSAGDLEIV